MPQPQDAIFTEGNRHHYALEFQLKSGATNEQAQAALKAALWDCPAAVKYVVGFGAAFWDRIRPDQVPGDLTAFQPISSSKTVDAPATQGDIWIWFQGADNSQVFDAAFTARQALIEVADILLSQPGFIYHDSKDLMGFEDGTANPKEDARFDAALIPDGQPGASGAIVFTQKWVHNLTKFNNLPVPAQEKVIGRTKVENIELEGDDMPEDSHVSRTDVKLDGVAQKIWRQSFPFGTTEENGLYFLCFACATQRVQIQLDRMFGVTEDGLHDRITEFSTPVSGAYWFAPSREALSDLLK